VLLVCCLVPALFMPRRKVVKEPVPAAEAAPDLTLD